MTLIVNLFGGPGASKSSIAYELAGKLKFNCINAELVTEVAKDFTWSERNKCIKSQPLIFGKQLYRIERLIGKVDVVITDSPILLSAAYTDLDFYPQSFIESIFDIFRAFDNANYFCVRTKPYLRVGRSQSESEAKEIDRMTLALLDDNDIPYTRIPGSEDSVDQLFDWTCGNLL